MINPVYKSHYDDELSSTVNEADGMEKMRLSDLLKVENDFLMGNEIPDEFLTRVAGSKERIPAVRFVTRQKTRSRLLRQHTLAEKLMINKWSVFGIKSEDSPEMRRVKDGYAGIQAQLVKKLPAGAEEKTAAYKELRQKYETVIGYCNDYIESRNPYTSSGKMRKQMVEEIRSQIEKDSELLRAGYENMTDKTGLTSFFELLTIRQPVQIRVDKLPENVGNGTSVVYKLSEDQKTYYFKPEEKKVNRADSYDIMQKVPVPKNDLQRELLPKLLAVVKQLKDYKVEGFLSDDGFFEQLILGMTKLSGNMEEMDGDTFINHLKMESSFDIIPENFPKEKVNGVMKYINPIDLYFGMARNRDGSFDTEKVNAIKDLIEQARQIYNAGRQMTGPLGMKGDEDLAVRNVASSRVAELLGVGKLLAHSESACIVMPDGKQIYGNRMEEAAGISYVSLTKMDGEIFFTREAADQMFNLRILDMICDQVDRNQSNIMCEVETSVVKNEEGKEVTRHTVTRIRGIDNDMSFGFKTEDAYSRSLKNKFRNAKTTLPKAQCLRFVETDTALLVGTLRDVLEPEALNALTIRFEILKNVIRDAMTEKPELFVDNMAQNELIASKNVFV